MHAENEFIPTRQSLLSRLKDWNDQESWKVFFDTYWRLIYHAGIKAGLSDSEAQDAVQETVISVMKSMPDFRYRTEGGSFKAWLLKLTRWRIADQFRKRQRAVQPLRSGDGTATETDLIQGIPDHLATRQFENMWNEEWENNLLDAALDQVKRQVDARQYQIFDLYVVKQWPATKVAGALKVNIGLVYLAKHRIGFLLQKHVAALQARPV